MRAAISAPIWRDGRDSVCNRDSSGNMKRLVGRVYHNAAGAFGGSNIGPIGTLRASLLTPLQQILCEGINLKRLLSNSMQRIGNTDSNIHAKTMTES